MIKKWSSLIVCFASMLILVPSLRAQAVYTATRQTRIQAGGGFLFLSPDYVDKNIQGVSFWGNYDFRSFIGAEVDFNLGSIITPSDISETSYMVGPRAIYHRRKFAVYGKLLVGRATITNQDNNASSSYNAYAFGGGLEYHVIRKVNIRVIDFTVQKWPNFEPNTLSPTLITVGASYIIK